MKEMGSEDDGLRRLQELDRALTRLTEEETIDSRVSFDYEISPRPVRVDTDGTQWFRVRLFITPRGGFNLTNIEKVVYVLHPTFKPPQVAVSNPLNGFALQIESWGDFHAMAIVVFKGIGETKGLIRHLPIGVKAAF